MSNNIKISIVTINYNGYADTCELVESLHNHMTIPYELIIVDNNSKENEAEKLKEKYKDVTIIVSDKNLGFSGGNNLGIKECRGEYIMLLNNDTVIEDDSINYLIKRMESNDTIGGISPKIKFHYSPQNIQFAGSTELSPVTLRNNTIGYNKPDDGSYDTAHSTPYLHGAAMLIRPAAIAQAGLMPEEYFLYYEELDWSSSMREKGYELWYEPQCTVYHKESQTTGSDSPLKVYYLTRNRLLYASRHRKGLQKSLAIVFQLTVSAPKNMLSYILRGKWKQASAIYKGIKNYVDNHYN